MLQVKYWRKLNDVWRIYKIMKYSKYVLQVIDVNYMIFEVQFIQISSDCVTIYSVYNVMFGYKVRRGKCQSTFNMN